ncbi:MAG: Rieske (2Fe-2S) protein [Candidatus Caenarcaniphilales bacterium]|nr:Rieske (2Fe-2S) protein [Candidatus Caenarcaniphilales bacterium]
MNADREIIYENQSPEQNFVDDPQRRNFMAALIGGASAAYAAGIGYVIFRYLTSGIENPDANLPAKLKIDAASTMTDNSGQIFKFGSKPGIIIKNAEGKFTAFTAICTHLGCTVSYQSDKDRIFCACHGGVYDPNTGKNISGPPPEPLKPFKVDVQSDGVYVEKA